MNSFIKWSLGILLALAAYGQLGPVTIKMAQAAIDAHMHDQMSYAKFTHNLLNAKPRPTPQRP